MLNEFSSVRFWRSALCWARADGANESMRDAAARISFLFIFLCDFDISFLPSTKISIIMGFIIS